MLLTGVQALARVPLDQMRIDRAAGRNTAALVTDYPGSPLGGFCSTAGTSQDSTRRDCPRRPGPWAPTWSSRPGAGSTNLIGAGEADAILVLDQLVGASDGVLAASHTHTRVIGSIHTTPTGAKVGDPQVRYPTQDELLARFNTATQPATCGWTPTT